MPAWLPDLSPQPAASGTTGQAPTRTARQRAACRDRIRASPDRERPPGQALPDVHRLPAGDDGRRPADGTLISSSTAHLADPPGTSRTAPVPTGGYPVETSSMS